MLEQHQNFDSYDLSHYEKKKIGDKIFYLSEKAMQGLKALDKNILAQMEITGQVGEIFGFGITKNINNDTILVEDFLPHEHFFNIHASWINKEQKKLMDLIATNSLEIIFNEQGITINSTDDTEPTESLNIGIKNGEINWQMCKDTIGTLLNIALPDNISELIELIKTKYSDQAEFKNQDTLISLETDFDVVTSGATNITTSKYFERLKQRANEVDLQDFNFTSHHHPLPGLLRWSMNDKNVKERGDIYKNLLCFSCDDLKAIHDRDIDFFQIRVFGTPENHQKNDEVTTRDYSVAEILNDSRGLQEALRKLQNLSPEHATPDILENISTQLNSVINYLNQKGYYVRELIKFYLEEDAFDQIRKKFRDHKNVNSNVDIVMYYLTNEMDNHFCDFPILTKQFFELREELGPYNLLQSIDEVLKQQSDLKKRITSLMQDDNFIDLNIATVITDYEKLKELSDKIRASIIPIIK